MSQTAVDRQFDLEGMMKGLGEKAYRDQVIQAREKGIESTTSYGRFLVKAGIAPVAEEVRRYYEDSTSGKAGRKSTCAKALKEIVDNHRSVDSAMDTIAFITLKSLIDTISMDVKAQTAAIHIGAQLQDECKFASFRQQNKALYDKLNRDLDSRVKSQRHKRTVMNRSANKAEIEYEGWTLSKRLQLGMVLIELAIQATGIAALRMVNEGRNKTSYYIQPTRDTLEWIKDRGDHDAALCPSWMPCVIPPKEWTTPFDGGYHSDEANAGMKLIKPVKSMSGKVKRNYLSEMAERSDEMPEVYEAVNAMQNTAWAINPEVLPVFLEVWDNIGSERKAGLPAWIDYEPKDVLEPFPKDGDWNTRKDWKRKASDLWAEIHRENSRVIQTSKIRFIAKKVADEPEIYFPHQLDFRGRVYSTPIMLHPQGSDLSRGLLRFSKGKPLTDDTAYRWWCIHGANVWGEDKLRLEERVRWVEDNKDMILRVGRDPLENTEWQDADSPWQALAWSMEYARREENPSKFESHIPVQLDGSCNGLQHFSAMLRDEIGGEATNLMASDRPQDIYQRVADRAKGKLRSIASDSETDRQERVYAQRWLAIGIDRKTTKRSVMIRPYGGTRRATQAYITEHLFSDRSHEERARLNPDDPKDMWGASMMLARVVYDALDEIVVASKEAMDWLRQVARLAAQEELPVTWSTPVGFHVLQAYPNIKTRRVTTVLGDSSVKLSVKTDQTGLDKSKQSTGISPNFVHSLDAAALMRYVCYAKARGIDSFSLIHDSYGTHAADTQESVDCLRRAFVDIYEQHDPLKEFAGHIRAILSEARKDELPDLPPKGNLDIRSVLESEYFFA